MKLTSAIAFGLLVAGCDNAYAASIYTGSEHVDENVTLVASHAMVTGANGMTLYTFDNDSAGTSNCYDDCAVKWPPYGATEGAQSPGNGLTVIERSDGTYQWAKDGAPLYFWAGDTAPGDTSGDGVGGVWHIAR
jgi:predicted lipoprotein with Yx(FWY)xxD motif